MNKLWVRLTLAFLLVVWLGIGAVAVVIDRTTEAGFRQYIRQQNSPPFDDVLAGQLEQYFAENRSWEGAESLFEERGRGRGRGGPAISVVSPEGVVEASSDAGQVGAVLPAEALEQGVVLRVDGQVVGLLYRQSPGEEALGSAESAFLEEAARSLTLVAVAVSLLAVGAGMGLAWLLARPLKRLADGILALPGGKLGQQIEIRGTVEIEALARAFNRMSAQLAEAEQLRQRMAADVAHELRTPVSVLRGHIEAMRDGVFAADQEHLAVAYDQTLTLGRLVDDLRLLTLAEARHLPLNLARLDAGQLVQEIAVSFQPLAFDAGVELHVSAAALPCPVSADATRLRQVLGNLLTNALRHTPDGGAISITVQRGEKSVRFVVSNSGSGLSSEDAQKVFLPFWRASEARERDSGGSGLGLAIARQIIELHQGRMWVEPASEGTRFVFELPLV